MKTLIIGFIGLSFINVFASVQDVGVIGPNSDVLLYYKDGAYINVKACEPNTVLGKTTAQARSNCQGKSNKVPLESFKQSLRNMVSTARLNVLRPISPEEIEIYIKGGPSSKQIEAMVIELEKINNFIANYGNESANLVRKEQLVNALRSNEARVRVINKINAQIEETVNLIADQTKLTLTKYKSDKDNFLYSVLKQFNPNLKHPCGLEGSVDQRKEECSFQQSSRKDGFVLVSRSMDFKEVYQEVSTGLLWSDMLPTTLSHYQAEKACNSSLKEVAGITGLEWKLPSIDDYKQAELSGIRTALPVLSNMGYFFWTTEVHHSNTKFAWLFMADDGDFIALARMYSDYGLVRCIGH